MIKVIRPLVSGVLAFAALSARSAFAHGEATPIEGVAWWSAWPPGSSVTITILILAVIYAVGIVRRSHRVDRSRAWRHVSFFVGLGAIFLSLQSPIDPIGERLFFVHQIQHLLLRMMGPMFIALAWPAGVLTAGTPKLLRRYLLAPVVSNRAMRAVFHAASRPVPATALFIGSLYFWQIPGYHNLGVADDTVHYVMHVSMFGAGLVFWLAVFGRRAAPYGIRHGVRLLMLVIAILSNIVLGSFIALKIRVLYSVYDVLGRPYGFSALNDEQIGGIIIWIPSSMMCLFGVFVVIEMYGRLERRLELKRIRWSPSNSAAFLYPTTGAELIARAGPRNRTMAAGFVAFTISIFAAAIFIGVLSNLTGALR